MDSEDGHRGDSRPGARTRAPLPPPPGARKRFPPLGTSVTTLKATLSGALLAVRSSGFRSNSTSFVDSLPPLLPFYLHRCS
ncbi:unnamed protein product [Rangifer tarandus platyrhynchus]|uniref:Uncharacterized protein n=2 Tax=Rangifer tarandus platyrhynchus TaxID=3082113 RepID=A0ABN8YTU8_RANTA|nr:unnamed protein product [Rangifer tarandus platyrhynchus]CAI9702578.1 unnamed protein product [Rangifer tarandus platyrhynchus]